VAESENIVVETAEKIFADLADTQTINRDKEGKWKAPLWQALTDAGLPLSWVPEECGGSGATMAEGFGVLGAAGLVDEITDLVVFAFPKSPNATVAPILSPQHRVDVSIRIKGCDKIISMARRAIGKIPGAGESQQDSI